MTALEILTEEHRLIKQFLAVLGSMLDKCQTSLKPSLDDLKTAVSFIQEFADGFHHVKEETILFQELRKLAVDDEQDQVGSLEMEHFLGRSFCAGMEEALEQIEAKDPEGLEALIDNGRAYIALLIQHTCKEDHSFFPWCAKQLDQTSADNLLALFEEATKKDFDPDIHQRWTNKISGLRDKYGVSEEVIKACH